MAKIHVIDGKRYRAIDRVAKVGDTVIVVEDFAYGNCGEIHTITSIDMDLKAYVTDKAPLMNFSRCIVLEPLESEEVTVDSSQASPAVIEMFTALSRKIVSLERQLTDTQRNVERQAEELENAKHRISKHAEMVEMLTDDVITLDERSQILSSINKYYAEGSR